LSASSSKRKKRKPLRERNIGPPLTDNLKKEIHRSRCERLRKIAIGVGTALRKLVEVNHSYRGGNSADERKEALSKRKDTPRKSPLRYCAIREGRIVHGGD